MPKKDNYINELNGRALLPPEVVSKIESVCLERKRSFTIETLIEDLKDFVEEELKDIDRGTWKKYQEEKEIKYLKDTNVNRALNRRPKYDNGIPISKLHRLDLFCFYSLGINYLKVLKEYNFVDEHFSFSTNSKLVVSKNYGVKIQWATLIDDSFFTDIIGKNEIQKRDFYLSKKSSIIQWYGICQKWAFERNEVSLLIGNLKESFSQKSISKVCGVVYGAKGTGKSTILKQIAFEIRNIFLVYYVDDLYRFDFSDFEEIDSTKRYIFIIDDWYTLDSQKLGHFIRKASEIDNLRIFISDLTIEDKIYCEHIYGNALYKLNNGGNLEIIQKITTIIPEYNYLLKYFENNIENLDLPIYILIYLLFRINDQRIREVKNKSGIDFFDFNASIRILICKDLDNLNREFSGLGTVLYYWSVLFKKCKKDIFWETILCVLDYLNGYSSVGDRLRKITLEEINNHEILSKYIILQPIKFYPEYQHLSFFFFRSIELSDLIISELNYGISLDIKMTEKIVSILINDNDYLVANAILNEYVFEKKFHEDSMSKIRNIINNTEKPINSGKRGVTIFDISLLDEHLNNIYSRGLNNYTDFEWFLLIESFVALIIPSNIQKVLEKIIDSGCKSVVVKICLDYFKLNPNVVGEPLNKFVLLSNKLSKRTRELIEFNMEMSK